MQKKIMPWKVLKPDPQVPDRLPRNQGGVGTLGRPINLFTNYYPVQFNSENLILYHFNVIINDVWQDKDTERDAGAIATPTAGAKALPIGLAPPPEPEVKKKGKRRKGRGGAKPKVADPEDEELSVAALDLAGSSKVGEQPAASASKIPRNKQRKIFKTFMDKNDKIFKDNPIAYDGEANAYGASLAPQLKQKFKDTVEYSESAGARTRKYSVSLNLVNKVKLKELLDAVKGVTKTSITTYSTTFQMLEIMFNYYRTILFETVGRNKFFSQSGEFGHNYSVTGGKEGVVGFFSSLRPVAGWKDAGALMLNVDTAHTAFYKQVMLLEFFEELRIYTGNELLDRRSLMAIDKEFVKKNIQIVTTHDTYKRKYKVQKVSQLTSLTHEFTVAKDNAVGKKVNVVQYFKERYNYTIKFPKLQCLEVGSTKCVYLPMEVCRIAPNQRVKGKLSDKETAEFIKQTAVPPARRLQQLGEVMRKNKFKEDPILQKLNVAISEAGPLALQGRVLPVPTLQMGSRKPFSPFKGVWDIKNQKFYNCGSLTNWAIADFTGRPDKRSLEKFCDMLQITARQFGMATAEPMAIVTCQNTSAISIKKELEKLKKVYKDLTLVLCCIGSGGNAYEVIKNQGDRELNLITQCVKQSNVFKCSQTTVSNILLKINAKLGGINFISYYTQQTGPTFEQLFSEPVLVMGADVNHPSASDMLTPSLVAVVGSFDTYASRYMVAVRPQDNREEIIKDLESITVEMLMKFRDKYQQIPKRIFMFRDGVSETQFTQVLRKELKAIRDACSSLNKDYKPPITFVCVQKRHHTRLYVQDPRDGPDRQQNVPPGTVVDTVITHRTEADFYLCSHVGIQGTSRPCHYHVLWDDSDFTMNQLQLLTYSLCHNYSRCARSVSMPTPAYYAHLAASRAKVHLEGAREVDGDRWVGAAVRSEGCYKLEDLMKATCISSEMSPLYDQLFYI